MSNCLGGGGNGGKVFKVQRTSEELVHPPLSDVHLLICALINKTRPVTDSLVDLALVSVALWSAVEAHGVDGDVGHLLRGNLHLDEEERERRRNDCHDEAQEKSHCTQTHGRFHIYNSSKKYSTHFG